jgi:glycosyltransferase involved in cell wall biosynthesis
VKIGIDARELCGQPTGVGRYLSALLHEWASDATARRHHFVLYAPGATGFEGTYDVRNVGGRPGTWWEQFRLPPAVRADLPDVFFSPAYTAPAKLSIPLVVTIHDLSFAAHPEWFRRSEGMRLRVLAGRAARKAHAVLTVSEFSRRELIEQFHVDADRIHVIPHGVSSLLAAHDGPRDPVVLFVGSIFNRRHVPELIWAFHPIARKHQGASLEIVGDNRTHPHQAIERVIESVNENGCIRWHKFVPDAELRALYGRARVFAFLSEYEGFGLTPVEALAAGVVPVLLDTAVARETCGAAASYVPVSDFNASVYAVTSALERALFDDDLRRQILAAAPEVLARYRWPEAARMTLAILEGAGSESEKLKVKSLK